MSDDTNEMRDRIAFLEREVAGYQRALKAAEEGEGRTVVLLDYNGIEMRIFGPEPQREQEMAEVIARWFKLIGVTTECTMLQGARNALDNIAGKLDEIEKVLHPVDAKEGEAK